MVNPFAIPDNQWGCTYCFREMGRSIDFQNPPIPFHPLEK